MVPAQSTATIAVIEDRELTRLKRLSKSTRAPALRVEDCGPGILLVAHLHVAGH